MDSYTVEGTAGTAKVTVGWDGCTIEVERDGEWVTVETVWDSRQAYFIAEQVANGLRG